MARGSPQAQNAATTASSNSAQLLGNAGGIYSSLVPQLTSQIANPQGLGPTSLANEETAAQQTAGGATAGAAGRGALLEGRTRNAGTAQKAIADAARSGGEQLSQANLGILGQNEALKQQQRNSALSGLSGLYGTNVGGGNTALGEVAPLVNANTEAVKASYADNPLFSGLNSLAGGFGGAYGAALGKRIGG